MFIRIFTYSLKNLSRKYWLVGWNFLFPLVLATAFFLGFGNLIKEDPDTFQTLEVGYVNELEESAGFDQVLEELSKENDEGTTVLNLHTYSSKDDAVKAMNIKLLDEEIVALDRFADRLEIEVIRFWEKEMV